MIPRSWKFWATLFGVATLVGLLEAAQVYTGANALGRPLPWARALSATLPSWYVLAALVPFVIWSSARFPFRQGSWFRSLLAHLPLAVLFVGVHIGLAGWLSDYVFNPGPAMTYDVSFNFWRLLSVYFSMDLFTYFALVGGWHAYDSSRRLRERESATAQLAVRTSRLEASLARANLESLRMQLNPHFLFNTLNAISVLAMKGDRHSVVRTLGLLSDLLRLSLEQERQIVTLREELEFLDRYLEIERVRFGDRLTLQRDVAPAALDAEVPSLVLQPLVENAIRHGISRRPGPGVVGVSAALKGGMLELRVTDSGVGIPDVLVTEGTGVGIANTRARLDQLYAGRFELRLENRPGGGAQVTVRFPFRIPAETPSTETAPPVRAAS